jgi:general secretion pathway protein G
MKKRSTLNIRRGFTLVELLVVMLILAVLAALIVPNVMGRTGQAKRSAALSDISTLSSLLQTFRIDCDRYPTTEEGLQALRQPPSDVQGWRGPYSTKEIPNDPWGNPYVYECPGPLGGDSFSLRSYGADGQPGGEGDAADITEGDQ